MNNKYFEALQFAANYYHLTDKCEIFRNLLESDGSGGVISRRFQISEEPCKIFNVRLDEKESGGGLGAFNEYRMYLKKSTDVKIADQIKIMNDSNKQRYFEVVGVNSLSTDTMFLTLDLKERAD